MKKRAPIIFLNTFFVCLCALMRISIAVGEVEGAKSEAHSMMFPDCDALWNRTDIALADYKDWTLEQSGGVSLKVVYMEGSSNERKAIGVRFKSAAEVRGRPQIVLKSEELSSRKFDSVESVSLALNADYGGHVRIIMRGDDGKAFFSKSPIPMKHGEWTESRRSLAKDAIVLHGKYTGKNKTIEVKQPYSVDHVRLSLPEGFIGEGVVKLSNIGIFNRTSEDTPGGSPSPYEEWMRNNCNYPGLDSVDVGLELPPMMKPVNVGSGIPVKVKARAPGGDAAVMTVTVNRFGAEEPYFLDEVLPERDKGEFSASFVHKFDSPGLYAINVALSDRNGKLLARVARSVMVWDPPGNAYQDNVPTFFGMMYQDRFPDTRREDLSLMAAAGVRVVRFPFRWSEIQAQKDRFSWGGYDALMKNIEARGFIAQPMVFYTPKWAGRNLQATKYADIAEKRPQWVAPRDPEAVAQFVGAAARRYKDQPVVWEIYNEPSESQHWVGGNANDYVKILRSVSREVRKATSDAGLITAGIGVVSAQNKGFMPLLVKNLDDVVDGFSVHAYGGARSAAMNISAAQEMMLLSKKSAGVWLNETGYLVDPNDPTGELRRSAALAKTAVVSRFMGAENFSWFIFRNYSASANLATDNYAITAADGSVRLPILAYANAVRWLAGSTPVRTVDYRQGVYIYEFMLGSKIVLAVWIDDEVGEADFALPIRAGLVLYGIYDMFGGAVDRLNDEISVNLANYPLFIVYKGDSVSEVDKSSKM